MNFVKTVQSGIFIALWVGSTVSMASTGIPLPGGKVLAKSRLLVPLNSVNKNTDYDVYCEISDITENGHNASISIGLDGVFVKKLNLNGLPSEHYPNWWGNLPAKNNVLFATFIKYGNLGSIELRNEDPVNTIVVSNCKAYLTN